MRKLIALVCLLAGAGALAEESCIELDFVEATGSQWIDTGIVGRYGTKAEIHVEWMALDSDMSLLASRGNDGTADNRMRVNFCNSTWGNIGFGYGTFETPTCSLSNGSLCNRRWEKDRVYTVVTSFLKDGDAATRVTMTVDGVELWSATTNLVVDTQRNLVIFGNDVDGTVTGLAKARCHGLKLWQDGVLVRDLKPCLKDGRAGFHDAVTKGFFFSASGTELVSDPNPNTPDRFIAYAESSGAEYIDTGVIGRSGLRMEADMMWVEVPSDGSFVSARKGADSRFYLYHSYKSQMIGYGGYSEYQSGVAAVAGVRQTVVSVLKNGEQTLTVDGTVLKSRTDAKDIDTGLPLYIFGGNKDGAFVYSVKARCYALKLWDGDTLVRDFRPCLKNGAVCLYDDVSGRIFRSPAGTLKTGGVQAKPGGPDYFTEYIEARGNNCLDTGLRARSDMRAVCDFALTQAGRSFEQERDQYLEGVYLRDERTVLGACAAGGGFRFYFVHAPNSQLWVGYGDVRAYPTCPVTNTVTDAGGQTTNTVTDVRYSIGLARHTVDATLAAGVQTVVYDGRTVFATNVADSVDAGGNLYLFACNKGGRVVYNSRARCYGLKLWQDNVLVRDFRPCVRDGEGALYDAVNDEVVFANLPIPVTDTGAAVLTGEEKPAQTLAYVETDGTQWIDTGVIGRSGTEAEFEMSWLEVTPFTNTVDVGLLGCRASSATDSRFYLWHNAWASMSWGCGIFSYVHATDPSASVGKQSADRQAIEAGRVYHVKSSFLPGQIRIDVDGETRVNQSNAVYNVDTGRSMYFFGYNIGGVSGCRAKARLSWMKIWQDGRLVRDFRPVMTNVGLAMLYDAVERRIYSSQKGGFVSYGPPLPDGAVVFVR